MESKWPEAPTWPSLDEIFNGDEQRLPDKLQQIIAQRYIEHGHEYADPTKNHYDGKTYVPVNLCMSKDNLQDVEEELVDAAFNALIYAMRYPQSNAGSLLHSLVMTWEVLQRERKRVADSEPGVPERYRAD